MTRARDLSAAHLGGRAVPVSVRWVENQNRRWGSCTPADGTIRLSGRLRGMPPFVVDYVLVHELAHLLEPNHNARFWSLVHAYPQAEKALGFLEGVEYGSGRHPGAGDDAADDDEWEPGAID
jgi:predicted metal-dependent hydrolase